MIRELYCLRCGTPRTFDTTRLYRAGGPAPTLACLQCGHEVFTTERARAPQFAGGVPFTVYDRRFLRSLRIGAS